MTVRMNALSSFPSTTIEYRRIKHRAEMVQSGGGNKAERTKLLLEVLDIVPRPCCTCTSFLFPFNVSLKPHLNPASSSLTLLCAQMADPKSFHVPPLLSIRSIRRIWRKRRLLRDVARTLPWFPTATTGTEAISTKISARQKEQSLPTKVASSPAS